MSLLASFHKHHPHLIFVYALLVMVIGLWLLASGCWLWFFMNLSCKPPHDRFNNGVRCRIVLGRYEFAPERLTPKGDLREFPLTTCNFGNLGDLGRDGWSFSFLPPFSQVDIHGQLQPCQLPPLVLLRLKDAKYKYEPVSFTPEKGRSDLDADGIHILDALKKRRVLTEFANNILNLISFD